MSAAAMARYWRSSNATVRCAPAGWSNSDSIQQPITALDMIELAGGLNLETVAMAPVRGKTVGAFRNSGLKRLNWGADEVILHLRRA